MASMTSLDALLLARGVSDVWFTVSGTGATVSFSSADYPHELDLINRMAANWRELQKAS